MSILTSNIMDIGNCLAGERFKFVVNGMHELAYEKFRQEAGLKRSVDQVKHLFWNSSDSIDIIMEKVRNYPIKQDPVSKMVQWIEFCIMKETNHQYSHTVLRKQDKAVFAMYRVRGMNFRMLSICVKEKQL